jgi:phospholipid/cholesterol/gamma-HCH transport system permease protein
MNTAQYLGQWLLNSIADIGAAFLLLTKAVKAIPAAIKEKNLVVEQMLRVGIGSMPLVLVTSIFTGGVAAVQAAYQFQDYVPMRYLGTVIGKSVVIELGPVLTALVVGGRVGASIAAELGTMKVTEQIDALEATAVNSFKYLAVTRIVACIIAVPLLTTLMDFAGILGGFLAENAASGMSFRLYFQRSFLFIGFDDFIPATLKTAVFGFIIGTVASYLGFTTTQGTEGVGRASTRSVVMASILIILADVILVRMIFFLFTQSGG